MMQDDQAQQGISVEALQAIAKAPNLVGQIDADRLKKIGTDVSKEYEIDLKSMHDWLTRMEKGLNLAKMMKAEDKNYPFDKCSNVIFPLITSAALQYNARAYPAIVPHGDIVKCVVHGEDQGNVKANRAGRVAQYMSHQMRNDSENWEDDTDTLLFVLPVAGHMFRKYWYDPAQDKLKTKLLFPGPDGLVVNAKAKSLDQAPRLSEVIPLMPHEIMTRKRSGFFADVDLPDESDDDSFKATNFIEQHRRVDLDGDGYEEPYIVTIHEESEKVVRVVAAYDMRSVRIDQNNRVVEILPVPFYNSYKFMPSFDGGFFGSGLGVLLGDVSETINTLINQLIDSGHLASLNGGFIGARDFKIRGGAANFRPGEWKQVNAYGADIRNSIVPLNFPGPSSVLFEMLGMMIEMGREIASVKDVMTGDSSRQMTATTTMALIEQGMMVFSASYKRIYRSLKGEFKMIADMNSQYLSAEKYNRFFDGQEPFDPQADFDLEDMDITPVADPKAVTNTQKMASAQFIIELAEKGLVDPQAASMRILEAAQVEEIEELMPKPDPMAEQAQQAQMMMLDLDMRLKSAEIDDTMASVQQRLASAQKDMADADATEIESRMAPMQARIEELKLMKEALSVQREQFGGMAGQRPN